MRDLEKMQPRPSQHELRAGNGRSAPKIGLRVASARTAVKEPSPAARRSARASLRVLDCLLAPASVLLWGAGAPRFTERIVDDCYRRKIGRNLKSKTRGG